MKVIYTDSLVIGGGLAGLRTAIATQARGLDTIVLSLIPAKRSHSAAAQGGMQASLAAAIKSEGDNEDVHFADTVKGSDWGCDQEVARMFANTAPKAIRELTTWGVPWTRVRKGDHEVVINAERVTITEKDEAHGLITARDFGGTKKWRTCYTADGTGHTMLYAMDNRAIQQNIPVHERKEAIALIHDNGVCHGAVVRDLINGELTAYVARATTISTGGYGRLYSISTNAVISEGIGAAVALETGVAPLSNMEAVQFHPTAIVPVGILTTEGCRGDGGLLKDVDGYRFMPDYEPEKKELASRDVVSRRMTEHIRKGKGVPSPYGDHLWLDITLLGKTHIEKNLREVKEICEYFLGIRSRSKEYIPGPPNAALYSMGGVRTDAEGREHTALRGSVSPSGEAACWDMHGFNRLGEQLGGRDGRGRDARRRVRRVTICDENDPSTYRDQRRAASSCERESKAKIDRPRGARGRRKRPTSSRRRMQKIMMEKVGISPHRRGTLQEGRRRADATLAQAQPATSRRATTVRGRRIRISWRRCACRSMIKLAALRCAREPWSAPRAAARHAREDYPGAQRPRLAQAHARDLAQCRRATVQSDARRTRTSIRHADGDAAGVARIRERPDDSIIPDTERSERSRSKRSRRVHAGRGSLRDHSRP